MLAAPDPPPLILMASPTGARRTKADHPALAMTPGEIAAEARACLDVGASALHVHVRDPRTGLHSLDPELYRAAFAAIEAGVGKGQLILQATTESAGRYRPPEQMAAVRALRPEAVSLALSELWPEDADAAGERDAAEFLDWLERERIAAQYICYTAMEFRRFLDLRRRGLIPGEHPSLIFVLGRYADGQEGEPCFLLPFFEAERFDVPEEQLPWMVCAFGQREGACALTAAGLGGHVRVGFENNLLLADGRRAPSTAALVGQAAEAAGLMCRRPATTDEARVLLGCRGR